MRARRLPAPVSARAHARVSSMLRRALIEGSDRWAFTLANMRARPDLP